MKIGDRVFTVKGRNASLHDQMTHKQTGPFSGRVVSIKDAKGNVLAAHFPPIFSDVCECSAVIKKADGRKVRVRIANLRPWDAREFKKVRREWER